VERTSAPKALGGEVLPPGAEPLQADDPAVIDGRRLTGRLASGGTSVVYLARDPGGEHVVVKTTRMRKADQAQARRWLRTEAACVRRLPAFCTAPLLVDGSDESPPYLIREYVEGPSLAQFVEGLGPLEPDQLGALAIALARALTAVHGAGLVHCDLDPANVLLAANGPRLIDFSIAQEAPISGRPAEVGTVPYNPGWVSPERLRGHPAGPASDVFGWGCLLGYAATGRSPFDDEDTGDERWSVARTADLDALKEPVRGLVEGALAADPADRPSAAELVAGLDGTAGREMTAQRSLPRRENRDVPPRPAASSVDAPTAPMPALTSEPSRPASVFDPEPAHEAPPRHAAYAAEAEQAPQALSPGTAYEPAPGGEAPPRHAAYAAEAVPAPQALSPGAAFEPEPEGEAPPHRAEYPGETEQADELVPWQQAEPPPVPRRVEYASEAATAAASAPPPRRRVEYAAETSGARSRAEWDDESGRRPRRLRTVAMVTAPAAMVAVLATVIAMAATGNGRTTQVEPGSAVSPGQGPVDSQAPVDPGHHSYGPRPASASSARDGSGTPSAGRHRHTRRTNRPGAPSRPGGGGHSPGAPHPSSPKPTPTHSPTPSPTPTPTGTGTPKTTTTG
jgi:serine/threonine protein kinase